MKFLGSLFTLVLSTCAVFVASKPDINQTDGMFNYWISTDTRTATVMGLRDKYANYVTLNPYVTVEGKKYYVNQIGAGAFSSSNLQGVIVNSNIKSLNISPNAFNGASNIRSIELNTENVTADFSAFDGIGTLVGFQGVGTPSLANSLAKQLLQSWNLPVGKDYTKVSDEEFKRALYSLAYKVKKNFTINDKIAYSSNVASVLALKSGSYNGIARAYRILAKNMGFQYHDVHVGGDGGRYSWNYVYIVKDDEHKRWFNVDIFHYSFRSSKYDANLFRTKEQQKGAIKSTVDPSNWIIYLNEYNYPNEYILVNGEKWYYNPSTQDFYGWCVINRSGAQA